MDIGVLRPIDGGFVGVICADSEGNGLVAVRLFPLEETHGKPWRYDVFRVEASLVSRTAIGRIGLAWERLVDERSQLIIALDDGVGLERDLVAVPSFGVELVVQTVQLDLFEGRAG
jgi:hypothetical protein